MTRGKGVGKGMWRGETGEEGGNRPWNGLKDHCYCLKKWGLHLEGNARTRGLTAIEWGHPSTVMERLQTGPTKLGKCSTQISRVRQRSQPWEIPLRIPYSAQWSGDDQGIPSPGCEASGTRLGDKTLVLGTERTEEMERQGQSVEAFLTRVSSG